MTVVDVRKVRVLVDQHSVAVSVLVRLITPPCEVVLVPVVCIMGVPIVMLGQLMRMFMLVVLREVQPHPPF